LSKKVGKWVVKNISRFYAFREENGKLYGAQAFSNIREDWIEISFNEVIETVSLPYKKAIMPLIPGLNKSPLGRNSISAYINRLHLPYNGKVPVVKSSFFI
jgi:hypothetical protein